MSRRLTEHEPIPEVEVATSQQRRFAFVVLLVTILGTSTATAIIAYLSLVGAPLKNSKETTYISAPLKSDGKQVDYFAAWEQEVYPSEIATDANGFRQIVQHLGAAPDCPDHHFAKICQKLGLDAQSLVPDMKFEDPFDFLDARVAVSDDASNEKKWALEEQLDAPWNLNDVPIMEAWLSENGPTMDAIRDAVEKPVFRFPLVRATEDESLIALLLPEIQRIRSFAQALAVRARYRIGTGDLDGAIADIVACKRLGRHVGRESSFYEVLVGLAAEGTADRIGIAGSLGHPPTEEQLKRLATGLNDLPAVGGLQKTMLFNRFTFLDAVQSLANDNMSFSYLEVPDGTPQRGIDWNEVARRINAHHDALAAGLEIPTPPRRSSGLFSRKVRSQMLADTIVGQWITNDFAQGALHRSQCGDRIHRITLAMLQHELAHGTLPPVYTADANGNPLQSWRVLLLPYLGQQPLQDKIRLDESWNSEHNRKFHDEAVTFYQCPGSTLPPGQTTYSVVVGPETPFEGGEGRKLADFGPKSAAMVLIVERKNSVCWMDPRQDVPYQIAKVGINSGHFGNGIAAGFEIASQHTGGANFGLRGGASRFIPETIDQTIFEGLLTGTNDD